MTDASILEAIARLGKVGIFAEPAAATAFAGLEKAVAENMIERDDPGLVLITGSGLKDVSAAEKSVTPAPIIEPSLTVLKRLLENE